MDLQTRELQLQQRRAHLEEWERSLSLREAALRPEFPSMIAMEPQHEHDPKLHHDINSFVFYVKSGRFLRSFVFGGLDGLTTTMVLVCSVSGLHHTSMDKAESERSFAITSAAIFTLGCANAIADAFSMGMGDLLSSLADSDTEDSTQSRADAFRNGINMFLAFILFGFVPLFAYTSFFPYSEMGERLRWAWLFCIAGLFSLGFLKGWVTLAGAERTVMALSRSGATMVLTGGLASAMSYFLSKWLHRDIPAPDSI
jgi:VIT1/CCC1 family predicted Fe2+/Mn2+ transporter